MSYQNPSYNPFSGGPQNPNSFGGDPNSQPDNIKKVRADVDEVKGIMHKNVDAILDNMEKASDLEYKTNELSQQSITFRKRSKKVKWQMIRNNWKLIGIISGVVLLIILIIVLISVANNKH